MLLNIFEAERPAYIPDEVEDLVEHIKRECGPFLAAMGDDLQPHHMLRRGASGKDGLWYSVVPRKNRRPLDTENWVHDEVDRILEPLAGFRPRSAGLFCTGSKAIASGYGREYIVFPAGEFKFIWSPYIKDLLAFNSSRFDGMEFKGYKPDGYPELVLAALKDVSDDDIYVLGGAKSNADIVAMFKPGTPWREQEWFSEPKPLVALGKLPRELRSKIQMNVLERVAGDLFKTGENSTIVEAIDSNNEIMVSCSKAFLVHPTTLTEDMHVSMDEFLQLLRM